MMSVKTALAVVWFSTAPLSMAAQPRPQTLPTLTLPSFPMPRPPDVVRAVYRFAAEREDVLRYVPCFCGCEASGHQSSAQCFVKSRAKNGDVVAWNDHGMTCAMCLAVAERAMQMTAMHASR